jgi:multidrug transporter EmrE-like cation transporter
MRAAAASQASADVRARSGTIRTDRWPPTPIVLALLLAAYVGLSTAGLLLLRRSLSSAEGTAGEQLSGLASDPAFLGGAVLYAASFTVWLLALRRNELSTVYPLFVGLGYAGVVVASFVLLGERASSSQLAGIVLVGVGALLLAR